MSGPLCVTAPAPTLVGLGLSLFLLRGYVSRATFAAAMVAFLAAAWRADVRVEEYRRQHTQMRSKVAAPERCFVRAKVVSSPTLRGDALGFVAEIERAECEVHSLEARSQVRLYGGPTSLTRGDVFEGVAQLGVVRLFRNADLPDPYVARARSQVVLSGGVLSLTIVEGGSGLRSTIDRARAHVRQRIQSTFAPDAVGMAKALVLGENDLTEEEDAAFKASGLAHLLAVSGTHLVFAVLSLVAAMRFVLVRFSALAERVVVGRISAALGCVLALSYADFAGGSGSAWRAAWMLAAALLMRALDREVRVIRAVSLSVGVGWVNDALIPYDLSFCLSLAATFGLLTLGQRWSAAFVRKDWPRAARLASEGLVATLAAMLPCSLLLALLSPSLSLLGIAANVLAAPFGEMVALPLCLGHALLSPSPSLEIGTAWVASGALLVVRRLALLTAEAKAFGIELPMPTSWQCACVAVACLAVALVRQPTGVPALPRRLAFTRGAILGFSVLVWSGLEWAATRRGHPTGQLRFTALDVGQGDASLVDLPDGQLMLVDGGGFVGSPVDPGARVILPTLRARRRDRVDVVVLSHPHPDHFGGLRAVLSVVEVGELWDSGQGETEGAGPEYAALLADARDRGVRVARPRQLCGRRPFGGAVLDVLGPCPGFTEGRDANDNSVVLRLGFGRRALLLTGDAELEQEQELIRSHGPRLTADLLKVGHHGSRTSTSREFLHWVRPEAATLSCGMRNRFGHPHQQTLDTLALAGVATLRIDLHGSVSWTTDGERAWIAVSRY